MQRRTKPSNLPWACLPALHPRRSPLSTPITIPMMIYDPIINFPLIHPILPPHIPPSKVIISPVWEPLRWLLLELPEPLRGPAPYPLPRFLASNNPLPTRRIPRSHLPPDPRVLVPMASKVGHPKVPTKILPGVPRCKRSTTNFFTMREYMSLKASGIVSRSALGFSLVSTCLLVFRLLVLGGGLTNEAGNLPTERVTKRDLFHIFHKYGKLAQISIKQAYGFIQFLDSGACKKGLDAEQGAVIRGRKVRKCSDPVNSQSACRFTHRFYQTSKSRSLNGTHDLGLLSQNHPVLLPLGAHGLQNSAEPGRLLPVATQDRPETATTDLMNRRDCRLVTFATSLLIAVAMITGLLDRRRPAVSEGATATGLATGLQSVLIDVRGGVPGHHSPGIADIAASVPVRVVTTGTPTYPCLGEPQEMYRKCRFWCWKKLIGRFPVSCTLELVLIWAL